MKNDSTWKKKTNEAKVFWLFLEHFASQFLKISRWSSAFNLNLGRWYFCSWQSVHKRSTVFKHQKICSPLSHGRPVRAGGFDDLSSSASTFSVEPERLSGLRLGWVGWSWTWEPGGGRSYPTRHDLKASEWNSRGSGRPAEIQLWKHLCLLLETKWPLFHPRHFNGGRWVI